MCLYKHSDLYYMSVLNILLRFFVMHIEHSRRQIHIVLHKHCDDVLISNLTIYNLTDNSKGKRQNGKVVLKPP